MALKHHQTRGGATKESTERVAKMIPHPQGAMKSSHRAASAGHEAKVGSAAKTASPAGMAAGIAVGGMTTGGMAAREMAGTGIAGHGMAAGATARSACATERKLPMP